MNATFNATINIGDAGVPFHVSIDVEYQKFNDSILIIDWMEDDCPYDNPAQLWFDQIMDAIDDFFFEHESELPVVFRY